MIIPFASSTELSIRVRISCPLAENRARIVDGSSHRRPIGGGLAETRRPCLFPRSRNQNRSRRWLPIERRRPRLRREPDGLRLDPTHIRVWIARRLPPVIRRHHFGALATSRFSP